MPAEVGNGNDRLCGEKFLEYLVDVFGCWNRGIAVMMRFVLEFGRKELMRHFTIGAELYRSYFRVTQSVIVCARILVHLTFHSQ